MIGESKLQTGADTSTGSKEQQFGAASREDFASNAEQVAVTREAIAEAAMAGDFDKAGELAQMAKGLKSDSAEMMSRTEDVARAENAERDAEKAREVAEAKKVAEDAARAEQAVAHAAKEAEDAAKASALAERIKSGNIGGEAKQVETSVQEKSVAENSEEEVGVIIREMKRGGYYKEAFSMLKPGELPSSKLTTNMICSLLYSSNSRLDGFAQVLMEKLPFDSEDVKEYVVKKVLDDFWLTKKSMKAMEIVGIDPVSLHDDAVKRLDRILFHATNKNYEVTSMKDVVRWNKTFNISEDEYAEALRKLYVKEGRSIGDDNLRALGFVKEKNGRVLWAWEKEQSRQW